MRKEEEERAAKIRKNLEDLVRQQKEGLEKEGAGIWDRFKVTPGLSPSPSPCMTPIDPRVLENRFGTDSPPPNRTGAPKMSPGGQHMGEGSQRVSLIPMEDVEITPGGKHMKAGSALYTLPPRHAQPPPAVPTYPRGRLPAQLNQEPVQPAAPSFAAPSHPRGSTDSSLQVTEMIPCPFKRQGLPIEVLGERHGPPSPTDEEGDTPMRNAPPTTSGPPSVTDNSPVTLPKGASVLGTTVTFGDFVPRHTPGDTATDSTEYTIAPSSAFEIATPPPPTPPLQEKTTAKPRQGRQNPATGSNLTPMGRTAERNPNKDKGKGPAKQTDRCERCRNIHAGKCRPPPDPCKLCGNAHSSKCRFQEEDRCKGCQKFHFGRCTAQQPGQPRERPQPPTRPLPPADPVPPKEAPTEKASKYHFIGTGRNCPAVTPTRLTKAYWRDNYNRIL